MGGSAEVKWNSDGEGNSDVNEVVTLVTPMTTQTNPPDKKED